MQLTRSSIIVLAAALALSLSAATTTSAHAGLSDVIINVLSSGRTMTFEHSTPDLQLKMRLVGPVYFTLAEDDIAKLDERALIEEKRSGITRRMEFKPDSTGGVKRVYRINNREVPYDAEAKRWLAATIPLLFREAGIDAERRVKRIHAASGIDGVMAEIDRIESNHGRGKYIAGLTDLGPLGDKQLRNLIEITEKLSSDFDQKTALHAILSHQTLGAAGQIAVLNIVAKMDSDFEQRSVIEAISPKLLDDATVAAAWQVAVKKISSDFEVRHIVESLAKLPKPSSTHIDLAIDATRTLDGDFEHAVALKSIIKHLSTYPAKTAAWLESARKIQSAHENREVLTAIINQVKLDKLAYVTVFSILDRTEGDFEKRSVLEAAAKRMPRDEELLKRFRQTASSLNDHERGMAERALAVVTR
jgi:hypothetical protein